MSKVPSPASLASFDDWSVFLALEFRRARKREMTAKSSLAPKETAYGALRSSAYRYLFKLNAAGLLPQLKAHVAARGAFQRGPGVTDAGWVLRLIGLEVGKMITPARRSRVAMELDFALRHNIDPELVLGFLYEVGSQEDILAQAGGSAVPEAANRYAAR